MSDIGGQERDNHVAPPLKSTAASAADRVYYIEHYYQEIKHHDDK